MMFTLNQLYHTILLGTYLKLMFVSLTLSTALCYANMAVYLILSELKSICLQVGIKNIIKIRNKCTKFHR